MRTFGRLVWLGAAMGLAGLPVGASALSGPDANPALDPGALSMAGFGGAMVMAEDQLLVGEGGNSLRPGMVYIHEVQGGSWARTGELMAPDARMGDGFGSAMAVAGNHLMVTGRSGVHLFARSGSTWSLAGALDGPADAEAAGFGAALAASGDHVLVGAPSTNENTGAVHVYRRSGDSWTRVMTLTAPAAAENDFFGASVALEGNMALVGAPGSGIRAGAVHAFRIGTSEAEVLNPLNPGALAENDRFGTTVAFIRGVAFASAPGSSGAGAVFAFASTGETGGWNAAGRWTAFDGVPQRGRMPGTNFGTALAATQDEVWIGSGTGVYVFSVDADLGVTQVRKETGGETGGGFGAAVVASGNRVAVGAPRADFGVGEVLVFEASDLVATLGSTPEEFSRVAGGEIECSDGEASVWECSEVNLMSYLPVSELAGDGGRGLRSNDNWGWQDPETGRKYAIVGMTDRSSFVDITDGENPRVVGILMMTEGARGSSWRDMKTFGNFVFIVSDSSGPHGMQVFDLTRLREHTSGEPVFFDEDVVYNRVASAHNIVINEDIGHAYIVGAGGGGETCGGGLHIVDINDPMNPTFAGCFSDTATGRAGTGYSHDAQCVTYNGPDAEYQGRALCFGSNETALSIADVTDPSNPVKLSSAPYPNVAYSHQGWLSDDHRYFYMNDELDEIGGLVERTRTLIWDVSDLGDPQLVAEHLGTTEASDHNLYIVGNLMYQSNYKAGLRILDISDPENPVEVAYFDTVPYGDNSAGTSGAWSNFPFFGDGTVISSGGAEGLFLLRPTIGGVVFD